MHGYLLGILLLFTVNSVAMDNSPVIPVAIGSSHCLMISQENEVCSRGMRNSKYKIPITIDLKGIPAQSVAASDDFSMVLTKDGTVYSLFKKHANWSKIQGGFEGAPHSYPIIEGLKDERIIQIAAGSSFACALNKEGKVFLWEFWKPEPREIIGLKDKAIKKITCGESVLLTLDTNGNLWSIKIKDGNPRWLGSPEEPYLLNRSLEQSKKIESMAAGKSHAIVLAEDKTIFSIGYNGHGQLGKPNTIGHYYPAFTHITNLPPLEIVKIVAGKRFSALLTKDGEIWWFGTMGIKKKDGHRHIEALPAKFIVTKDRKITDIFASPLSDAFFVASGVNLFENPADNTKGRSSHKFYFDECDNIYFDHWNPNNHYLQSKELQNKIIYIWFGMKNGFPEIPIEVWLLIFSFMK